MCSPPERLISLTNPCSDCRCARAPNGRLVSLAIHRIRVQVSVTRIMFHEIRAPESEATVEAVLGVPWTVFPSKSLL